MYIRSLYENIGKLKSHKESNTENCIRWRHFLFRKQIEVWTKWNEQDFQIEHDATIYSFILCALYQIWLHFCAAYLLEHRSHSKLRLILTLLAVLHTLCDPRERKSSSDRNSTEMNHEENQNVSSCVLALLRSFSFVCCVAFSLYIYSDCVFSLFFSETRYIHWKQEDEVKL